MILALHLKRFKYMEQLQRYTKLSYRVVFPLELRLFNTSGDATNPERLYDLVAVVVHCGRWAVANTLPEHDTYMRQTNPCSNNKMHYRHLVAQEYRYIRIDGGDPEGVGVFSLCLYKMFPCLSADTLDLLQKVDFKGQTYLELSK